MRKPQLNIYYSFELLLYLSQLNSHMITRLDFMLISPYITINLIIKVTNSEAPQNAVKTN